MSGRAPRVPPLPPALARARRSEFSTAASHYVVLTFPLRPPRVAETLTAAEKEVAAAVLSGLSNAAIGRARGTSPRTVANQIASIFTKLGVRSRLELARVFAGTGGRK